MRAKIPKLKDPLQSRFTIEHHGIMVAQLLAHIDTLDQALQNLSERIEYVLAPHAQTIALLSTIPGVQAHAAQVLIAECGSTCQCSRRSGTSRPGLALALATTNQPGADARDEPDPGPRG
jgi:transposase